MDLFTLVARLSMDTSEYDSKIGSARKSFSGMADAVSAKAVAMGTMVAHGLEKAASMAVDLGKSAVTAAAEVAAEQAQFTATFGELQGSAEKAFDRISKSTGVFGTRLQNVGTKAFSQFKGAGLDAVDALGSMEQYTNLAADAAAYYDISLEEADEKLRSFLRGNTEAGDAIGLFTSESQRNTYAMEKYGAKWTALTEAQKQMLMLDVAQDIYEQSGAIGQAARESDNWTNVVGNLKEVWRQTLAVVGEPVMETLTPIIKELTTFLGDSETQLKFEQFGESIGNIANSTFDGIRGFLTQLTEDGTVENKLFDGMASLAESVVKIGSVAFDGVTTFIDKLFTEGSEESKIIDGIVALMDGAGKVAESTWTTLTGVIDKVLELLGIEDSGDFFSNAGTLVEDVGTFVSEHSEELGAVIAGVLSLIAVKNPFAALIAALVLIVGNWKDIKKWCSDALDKFREFISTKVPSGFLSGAISAWNTILGIIQTALATANQFISSLSGARIAAGSANITAGYESGGIVGAISAAWDSAWWNPDNWGTKTKTSDSGKTYTSTYDGYGAKGFATGIDYVPYNNFPAYLHEGEGVLTKAENAARRTNSTGGAVINEASLASTIAAAVADALNGAFVNMDGERVGQVVLPTVSRGIAQGARSKRYATV